MCPGDSLRFYEREAFSTILRLEKDFGNATLVSLTGRVRGGASGHDLRVRPFAGRRPARDPGIPPER